MSRTYRHVPYAVASAREGTQNVSGRYYWRPRAVAYELKRETRKARRRARAAIRAGRWDDTNIDVPPGGRLAAIWWRAY